MNRSDMLNDASSVTSMKFFQVLGTCVNKDIMLYALIYMPDAFLDKTYVLRKRRNNVLFIVDNSSFYISVIVLGKNV